MKLLHIGDLHLGKSLGEFDLSEDQKYILDQILKIAEESKVDAVLIAGDVYDKAVPSEAATKLLDYFLSRLSCMGVDTFVISGNHEAVCLKATEYIYHRFLTELCIRGLYRMNMVVLMCICCHLSRLRR